MTLLPQRLATPLQVQPSFPGALPFRSGEMPFLSQDPLVQSCLNVGTIAMATQSNGALINAQTLRGAIRAYPVPLK
jgi:hypothetical protein